MKPLLILNGILATSKGLFNEDLVISEGKIVFRGKVNPSDYPEHDIINAFKRLVIPGGIDPHVHFALPTAVGPSCDDFESGSQAALSGGTTFFMDFVTPVRGESLLFALKKRRLEAKRSVIDHRLHMGISEWNQSVASEVHDCFVKEGITSFKAYLAYGDTIGINLVELEELMKVVGSLGGLVMVHCEEGEEIKRLQDVLLKSGKSSPHYHAASRLPETEIKAVEKVINLAAKTGCRTYIVHVSTGEAVDLIRQAKQSGVNVYAETCPHYLLLDKSVYSLFSNGRKVLPYIFSPPLRSLDDQDQLWEGLRDGTIDVVATDHCPFNLAGQKEMGLNDFTKIPNGVGGVELRIKLLYTYGVLTNYISFARFVDLVSTKPAEIFGLGGCKGKLDNGFDADIAILNPDMGGTINTSQLYQKCDHSIFDGFTALGKVEKVIVNGNITLFER